MIKPSSILMLFLLHLPSLSFAHSSAVILQYHNVSTETAVSTSVTPDQFKTHLAWIKEHGFDVLALPKLVETLKNKQHFTSSKVLAITFDDAHRSVCETAWPILKKHKLPFTLFINTEAIERSYPSQCSWSQLKDIYRSGLLTLANHSHQHLNMVSGEQLKDKIKWLAMVKHEILRAQSLIESNIGQASHLFAYPFGEYNSELASEVTKLGFIGFGQHSGAVGFDSDFSALPRFPASGQFANLKTLSVKLYSLAYPAQLSSTSDNPIPLNSKENPPTLKLTPTNKKLLSSTHCYNSRGENLPTKVENNSLLVTAKERLTVGRHRYTCTSQSDQTNRFYWLSHQWLIEDNSANWFSAIYENWFN